MALSATEGERPGGIQRCPGKGFAESVAVRGRQRRRLSSLLLGLSEAGRVGGQTDLGSLLSDHGMMRRALLLSYRRVPHPGGQRPSATVHNLARDGWEVGLRSGDVGGGGWVGAWALCQEAAVTATA